MDLVIKGRGGRVSPETKQRIERKLSRLTRIEERVQRTEVQVVHEPNPRVEGGFRVEAAFRTPRKTFRASGSAPDVETALDRVVDRLERQINEDRGKRRARLIGGASRVKSANRPPESPPGPEA